MMPPRPIDVYQVERALHNARHEGIAKRIAECEAECEAVYRKFDLHGIVEHLGWTETNLVETQGAHYPNQEEKDREVMIATTIRDKALAVRDTLAATDPVTQRETKTVTAAEIRDGATPTRYIPDSVEADGDAI